MSNKISNSEKHNTYANLMVKLGRAIKAGFYFEACLISYAILEDRTAAALYYADISRKRETKTKLYIKTNQLREKLLDGNDRLQKYFSSVLLDQLDSWRQKRNSMTHGLANLKYNVDEFKEVAIEGQSLAKEISNKTNGLKKLYGKKVQSK